MLYPIAIEPGDADHAWGVVVPDIAGCFSAGESLDDAVKNAKEAIEAHLQVLAEDGGKIPFASEMSDHVANPDFAGWAWAFVDIDINDFLGGSEKINITLPRIMIRMIDEMVTAQPNFRSRSGFLNEGAQRILRELSHRVA